MYFLSHSLVTDEDPDLRTTFSRVKKLLAGFTRHAVTVKLALKRLGHGYFCG